jgi:hypothetical protein
LWSGPAPTRGQENRQRNFLLFDFGILLNIINAPFLFELKGKGSEIGAGLQFAIERGWLELHESGTYVRLKTVGDLVP